MVPTYDTLKPPTEGDTITMRDGALQVPDRPVIPFIEGDGTGPDIWRASVRVFDAAVQKAYGGRRPRARLGAASGDAAVERAAGGRRKIAWMEVYAGEKSFKQFNNWLPDDTVAAFQHYLVGI